MSTRATLLAAIAIILGTTLAGCSRSDDASPPDTDVVTRKAPAPQPAPAPSAAATAAATPIPAAVANAAAEAPKEAPRTRDEQMIDDASATGMTARATREEPSEENATEQSDNE